MEQLVLDLGMVGAPPHTVVSQSNEAAYALLAQWPRWSSPIVLVTGPEGSGKSHLTRRFAETAGVAVVHGGALNADDALTLAEATVVVDDADKAADRALFHLINAVRNAGGTMLLTASRRPVGGLRDLDLRLRAFPEVALEPPDDALIRRVMIDAFQARQLPADSAVLDFLMARMERTLHEAMHWVDALDKKGLAEKRGPTRPLAARLLQAAGGSAGDRECAIGPDDRRR